MAHLIYLTQSAPTRSPQLGSPNVTLLVFNKSNQKPISNIMTIIIRQYWTEEALGSDDFILSCNKNALLY